MTKNQLIIGVVLLEMAEQAALVRRLQADIDASAKEGEQS